MNERPHLPLRVQAGYASADIGLNTVETVLRIYLLIYYTDEVGLQSGLAGLAVGLGLVWDAVTDPIMGTISDRTRDRFGGRRGYLPPGGLMLALGVWAVFWPPVLDGQSAKFVWLLLSFCALNTGMTVLSVPFMAMAGEMTADPHERATLFGWRFAFANLGAMLAAAMPALFLGAGQRNTAAMGPVSLIAAGLVVASAMCSWWVTRGLRFLVPPLVRESLRESFRAPLRNAAFRPLLLAYVVATIGIGVNAATALYYYRYWLLLTEAQTQVLLVVFVGVFTLSILGWVRVARTFGKRRPMVFGASVLGLGTTALYLGLEPGSFVAVLVLGGVGLGWLVGCIVLIDTMLTDVLDHDLVRARRLRSGLFFGVWRFASKLARAGAIAFAGLVLQVVGFVPQSAEQRPAVDTALRWLFGPGVGGFFLLAAWILWRYRFDEQKQAQVRRILARRRAGTASSVAP
ncbi:MAG TPA: MFS transporter [Planctomycetota bacterium]|nr:MFS transporter [Planctomycetota bacterium]